MTIERRLLAAFACSGFAALVYEIVWTRLLTLHLGHTTAAVSTVTAAFMGGLGLGAAFGGPIASKLSRQAALVTYAALELAIGLAALAIPGTLTLLSGVFAWAYGEYGAEPLFGAVRMACTIALLLLPCVALGATFPMAVRVAVGSPERPGGAAGRLYGANTAGAAIGSLMAGFFFVPLLGLMGTTMTGVAASAGGIALALYIARRDLSNEAPADIVKPAILSNSLQQFPIRPSMDIQAVRTPVSFPDEGRPHRERSFASTLRKES